jgi:purine-nucleoside phosphorylase
MNEVIERAVEILSPLCGNNCKIGLILGSGLGEYAERIENKRFVSYSELPGFPSSACRAGFIIMKAIRNLKLRSPFA